MNTATTHTTSNPHEEIVRTAGPNKQHQLT